MSLPIERPVRLSSEQESRLKDMVIECRSEDVGKKGAMIQVNLNANEFESLLGNKVIASRLQCPEESCGEVGGLSKSSSQGNRRLQCLHKPGQKLRSTTWTAYANSLAEVVAVLGIEFPPTVRRSGVAAVVVVPATPTGPPAGMQVDELVSSVTSDGMHDQVLVPGTPDSEMAARRHLQGLHLPSSVTTPGRSDLETLSSDGLGAQLTQAVDANVRRQRALNALDRGLWGNSMGRRSQAVVSGVLPAVVDAGDVSTRDDDISRVVDSLPIADEDEAMDDLDAAAMVADVDLPSSELSLSGIGSLPTLRSGLPSDDPAFEMGDAVVQENVGSGSNDTKLLFGIYKQMLVMQRENKNLVDGFTKILRENDELRQRLAVVERRGVAPTYANVVSAGGHNGTIGPVPPVPQGSAARVSVGDGGPRVQVATTIAEMTAEIQSRLSTQSVPSRSLSGQRLDTALPLSTGGQREGDQTWNHVMKRRRRVNGDDSPQMSHEDIMSSPNRFSHLAEEDHVPGDFNDHDRVPMGEDTLHTNEGPAMSGMFLFVAANDVMVGSMSPMQRERRNGALKRTFMTRFKRSLTSIFCQGVEERNARDVKELLKELGFNMELLIDVSKMGMFTYELVVPKGAAEAVVKFLKRDLPWEVLEDFDPTTPASDRAPENVQADVFAKAVRKQAMNEYIAKNIKRNTSLFNWRTTQRGMRGERFGNAVEAILQQIDANPGTFFPSRAKPALETTRTRGSNFKDLVQNAVNKGLIDSYDFDDPHIKSIMSRGNSSESSSVESDDTSSNKNDEASSSDSDPAEGETDVTPVTPSNNDDIAGDVGMEDAAQEELDVVDEPAVEAEDQRNV